MIGDFRFLLDECNGSSFNVSLFVQAFETCLRFRPSTTKMVNTTSSQQLFIGFGTKTTFSCLLEKVLWRSPVEKDNHNPNMFLFMIETNFSDFWKTNLNPRHFKIKYVYCSKLEFFGR